MKALSKVSSVVLILIVIIAIIGGVLIYNQISKKTVTTTTIALKPSNTSVLVDVAQTVAPDSLDPATDFLDQVEPLFYAVFQELVEPNGSNYLQVVPIIAQNYTISSNYQNYYFYLRPCVHFADGVQVNASTVWFSLYRTILMGQPPGVADYICILFNQTIYSVSGYAIPWGVCYAIENATGLHTVGNYNLTAHVLAYILSHFNANNATIQKIMSYPNQAVVVKGPYEVEINLLHPYKYFLLDMANSWGAIVDPVYIDEHGGVQPNEANCYINAHGMPGTGPYEIEYVGPSFNCVVLVANPNYWATGKNVPIIAESPHIKVIEIYYGVTHNDRVEDFLENKAQISYVSIPYLGQVLNQYPYSKINESQVFYSLGILPGVQFIAMNTQKFPTNITDFRLAIEHAINYSQLLSLFSYNGKELASEFLGPISPQYGKLYNPNNLSVYSYNLSMAIHYLNEAGYEGHFYVVLPNGSVIGDSNGIQLPTLEIIALAPVTQVEQEEFQIITEDLAKIGISVSVQYVLFSVISSYTSPQSTPNMVAIGWTPDWPDPIFQQMMPLTDIAFGGPSGNFAWFNNSDLQSMYNTLPFITNTTLQEKMVAKAYSIIYDCAPYIWLPVTCSYYLIQPYVKGVILSVADGYLIYFYNTMYYSN
ncbi:ABC transporter substrate-binding protein [Acidianus ambivalens]|uniref:ABC transporter substrate-binding protein n=1 Tax=Acidianus ambivalens TaxID=2283 RepID=A0A650CWB0_ACIAM|nr:ABC transporter substrate-binding protein [Acidianus ambivalens]MQL54336.1 ABC transporter substrate-binding protein [Acidianus ambivalens]QGR22161.1 ABC transporter substrate-binding protein [Acidianus ambivalens]